MSGITLKKTLDTDIPTPAADKVTVFIDDATGEPSYKDETATVVSLKGEDGAAGATGAAGAAGADGADGEPICVIPVVIGDGLNVMGTGVKGWVELPFACTIIAARLFSDATGSIVIDVGKATYSGLPTFSSICASAKPTLSSARKSEDVTLTGWTTAVSAGDWLQFTVDSVATIKLVTISITVQR